MSDLISRADAIEAVRMSEHRITIADEQGGVGNVKWDMWGVYTAEAVEAIKALPSAEAVQGWIPCSERLPDDIRPVLVTWKNTDPASYYQYIVGKHFIGTAHYCKGKWYWYSSVTEDLLAEYGKCESEEFDEAIEAVAWMPLPKPYREESEVEE